MKNNTCYGCQGYVGLKDRCAFFINSEKYKNKCPCRKCLLKGICKDGCEEFTYMVYDQDNVTLLDIIESVEESKRRL